MLLDDVDQTNMRANIIQGVILLNAIKVSIFRIDFGLNTLLVAV